MNTIQTLDSNINLDDFTTAPEPTIEDLKARARTKRAAQQAEKEEEKRKAKAKLERILEFASTLPAIGTFAKIAQLTGTGDYEVSFFIPDHCKITTKVQLGWDNEPLRYIQNWKVQKFDCPYIEKGTAKASFEYREFDELSDALLFAEEHYTAPETIAAALTDCQSEYDAEQANKAALARMTPEPTNWEKFQDALAELIDEIVRKELQN
jgi:hypothetical protein